MSKLSYIHENAVIGKNTDIGAFTTVDDNVVIGDDCWIGPNVTIMSGARIGNNCKIFPGAVISAIPQDLKFQGENTTAEIGDNSVIRECVTINRGTADRFKTAVGSNCLIMAYVHVAHDCVVGDYSILGNSVQMAGHVVVHPNAIIAGTTAIHQFVHIGSHTMIRGGSLVSKDVPPFTKAGREPLSYVGVNSIGLRRRGFSNEKINEIQDIYRTLYLKGHNNSKALELIETELPASEERDIILDFVKNSSRGIMRGYIPLNAR